MVRLTGGTTVTDTLQQSISKMRLRAPSAALALAIVLLLASSHSAQAQTLTILYNFAGPPDGANPFAGVVRDAAGNLYGTTYTGASSDYGTVFKVDPSGNETVLYSFTGGDDGGSPVGGVVRDTAGNLYGTTQYGGAYGYGAVFKVDKSGTESVVYSFQGGLGDGCNPYGGLVRDKAGNLYGTTPSCGASNLGTVFKVAKNGTGKLLHSFTGGKDGSDPLYTALLLDTKGNLYGVTAEGGSESDGVVYRITGRKLTVLHTFTGGTTDGCFAHGTPAMDKQGNLYGTTSRCGSGAEGTVWKVTPKGKETVLYNFAGGSSDGANPIGGVILDGHGNFYGDTDSGGPADDGTIFELNNKGMLTLLHSFAGGPSDGGTPFGGVIRDAKGNLYGTTLEGGTDKEGTVWKLTP
jgi:uncharacterized repeat protein (TIGR03803 family)